MFFPYPVIEQMTEDQVSAWNEHFSGDGHERRRTIEEGVWRRTQEPANAEQSGWSPNSRGRRRVVHYRYEFGINRVFPVPRLTLDNLYLTVSFTAPATEIVAYRRRLAGWLADGRWRRLGSCWAKGDLRFLVAEYGEHPQDERAGRPTPEGFRSLDVRFLTDEFEIPRAVRNLPWDVLAGGMRIRERRGDPTIAPDLSELRDHLPFQVEIGCGTSIEAGVPPLHHLHEVYRVTARKDNTVGQSHAFTLSPQEDSLVREMLISADVKAPDLVAMFRACFLAKPTGAHRALRALQDTGAFVGPVITHNFDALPARSGLQECFVRRYDQRIPPVPLLSESKALLVIGLHADRRAVQQRARAMGKKIFFVDPEGVDENGVFKEYLIEGAREGDIVVRQGATRALAQFCELLGIRA
ncbi:hypothetical protein [Streptomyces profundus]|uniref:hypothetical protein n=1 Tax=Streptomyces profundus TaxID=2867410 RepID=UPI001D16C429|nr:hypothetical protein [Streptomyces sp. MA3_2.13]UED84868.1 hypothetical protein K4G22_12165 [Streptomyces sp. MA3_2.13]